MNYRNVQFPALRCRNLEVMHTSSNSSKYFDAAPLKRSIQPHVRTIVRGKTNAKVEFVSKINVSLMNGYAFIDKLSWDEMPDPGSRRL